eukprot:TRINITY_DN24915_c0_g1_i1.p1 TRINITY_DN24915_c0_g1~~TRINITY_DN24915_c0_g1_i1.p1  ORF type:complete len:175 (+),score=36.69 TRINITY_DN24915_c0_g1_i1:62-586(+)
MLAHLVPAGRSSLPPRIFLRRASKLTLPSDLKYSNGGELKVGHWAQITKTWTEADVQQFSAVTGDANPVHLDEAFAKTTMFKTRIVHGMLTASLFSALLATECPGPGTIYLNQNLKFKKPVFLNDSVTVTVQVKEINAPKKQVTLDTIVENQHGAVVIDGDALTMAVAEKFPKV